MPDIITTEEIYKDILKKIVNLELKPGSMISENKICEEYNVSRSVIRNIFARLSQLDFITAYPQRGTYVNKININYLKSALIIRVAIEKEMIYRFIKSNNKSDKIIQMEINIKKQKNLYHESKNNNIEEYNKLDEEFHQLILDVDNNNIIPMINTYLLHINRWRNIYIKSGNRLDELIDEHKSIFNAILENDANKAVDCMSKHIHTMEGMVDLLEQHADFFE